jgi:hypothetical protein
VSSHKKVVQEERSLTALSVENVCMCDIKLFSFHMKGATWKGGDLHTSYHKLVR